VSDTRRASKPARQFRLPRAEAVIGAVGALILAGVAALAIAFVGISRDLQTSNANRVALAEQVRQLGGTPIAGAPGSPGPAGASGPPGASGAPGQPGSTGAAGTTGKPGPSGAPGQTGATGSPGPVGASGAPGKDGTEGSPGPAGAQGEAGPAGPQGPQGEKGATGDPGPAPSGWTYTDGQGTTYECTPDADGSTHYTCTAVASPEPSPSPSGPLSLGGIVSTAAYRRRL
jgi:hypothetical protein